jgi:hypothetical protein
VPEAKDFCYLDVQLVQRMYELNGRSGWRGG